MRFYPMVGSSNLVRIVALKPRRPLLFGRGWDAKNTELWIPSRYLLILLGEGEEPHPP